MDNAFKEALKERTKAFGLRVIRLFRALPRSGESGVIGHQLLRSGTSVGANYRAVCRARSTAEFVAKLGIVIEEADESLYWLELLEAAEIVPVHRLAPLHEECNELTAIFVSARETARRIQKSKVKSQK
jgi:four helix bundle protein